MKLRGLGPNSYIPVSDLYIPSVGLPFLLPRNNRWTDRIGIYKSLTDTYMWKLELRSRSFFSGNT